MPSADVLMEPWEVMFMKNPVPHQHHTKGDAGLDVLAARGRPLGGCDIRGQAVTGAVQRRHGDGVGGR